MSDEKETTTTLERWRAMFTPEAREERLLKAADRNLKRSTAIERAFGKRNEETK